MRFYEFESKRLLGKHGVPVVQGGTANTAEEAEKLASEIGCPVIVKAQVLSPGLLKEGASREAASPAEAKKAAAELLSLDDGGRPPKGLLIEQRPKAAASFSLALSYDGVHKKPVIVAAAAAGDIDDIAEASPDAIVRRHFSALVPFSDYIAKEVAAALGLTGPELNRMTGVISRLARLFLDYDLTQADIAHLAKLEDGKFAVLDCYCDMEVEGRPRQKAILAEFGIDPEDSRAVREPTQFELDGAKIDEEDPRGIVGPVVEFDGSIGLVIGAGGGSLTLTDAVRKHGGRPANYAAIGGNPSVGKARALTKLVLNKPGVEKIAVMSNVVSNTRADLVARGVIMGVLDLGFEPADKIVIFRVPGAWEADAAKILEKYGIEYCDRSVSISEAARRAVEKIGS